MKNNIIIKILGLVILYFIILSINNKVLGATAKISAPSTVYVGDTITVKVTGNAASWSGLTLKASGNVTGSGGTMADSTSSGENENVTMGTYTFTATSVGSATFTLSGLVVNHDYTNNTIKTSKTVKIIKKEEPKQETTQTTTTTKPTTNKTTTTTKSTTTQTKTTIKNEDSNQTQIIEDDFYINKIALKGIKESGEKIDIVLSPEFNKNIYEYSCNITADIQKIELEKEAGNYTDSVIVNGLEELKEGENVISLQLSAENHQAKIYNIKVVKDEKPVIETIEETESNNYENNKEEKRQIIVSMPLFKFIAMQVGIIIIEILLIYYIPWKKLFKKH